MLRGHYGSSGPVAGPNRQHSSNSKNARSCAVRPTASCAAQREPTPSLAAHTDSSAWSGHAAYMLNRPCPAPVHNSSRSSSMRRAVASAAATAQPTADDRHVSNSSKPLTAVVVGSGMSGLSTAAALSDTFDRVIVMEADSPKESWHQSVIDTDKDGPTRPGVGQYQLLHVIMARGAAELNKLVPGYVDELLRRGAVQTDFLTGSKFVTPAGQFMHVPNSKQPLQMIQASRHLVEQTLRDMVSQNPKISFSYKAKVKGLVFDNSPSSSSEQQQQRVTGVKLTDGSDLSADLVVVASGRRGNVTKWLGGAGWGLPTVSKTSANCRYVSWLVKIDPEVVSELPYNGWYYQVQPPHNDTAGILQQIEDDVWIACIVTGNNGGPRAELEAAVRHFKEHPYIKDIYEVLKHGTPVSRVNSFGSLNNTWNHYEQSPPPEGLLITGDAYCNFNPIYGQGMTVAALEAGILQSVLEQRRNQTSSSSSSSSSRADSLSGLSADFYPAAAEVVGASWLFAALKDLQFPFATAENQELTLSDRFLLSYVDVLYKVATFDAETSETFCRAVHMLDPPSAMFKPSILTKALAHVLTGWPWGLAGAQATPKTPSSVVQTPADGLLVGQKAAPELVQPVKSR